MKRDLSPKTVDIIKKTKAKLPIIKKIKSINGIPIQLTLTKISARKFNDIAKCKRDDLVPIKALCQRKNENSSKTILMGAGQRRAGPLFVHNAMNGVVAIKRVKKMLPKAV
ncbi:MAG TPA: hypothetical protein DCX54_08790 [Flavobacteriales bacterium]|nr:hypothetical protein [Flavobacteriales bacterium]